jgi:CspA family cold shock protein
MSNLEVYGGEVIWFHVEYGYGFIAWEKDGVHQPDMFAHFSDVVLEGFKLLKAGQQVTFTIGTNNEGKPKATDIRVIG